MGTQFKSLTVETLINAPLQKVWESYTQPEHIVKWNQASDDWHTVSAENDLRSGGKFKSRMEAKDGSFGFDFEGTYDCIDEYSTIEYTMPDKRRVIVSFYEEQGVTRVNTVFDPDTTNSLEMQQEGWQAILNNFKTYTEELS